MILFTVIFISIKLFLPKREFLKNNIDVLCLFNYIILKIVCPALRKDFVILQLYWWLFSSTKHVAEIWSDVL